jgi:hypothetical protein
MTRPTGITLEYHLAEAVSLVEAPSIRHVERWTVTVRADDTAAADGGQSIGDARLIVLNLEPGMTPADLADETTGDWVDRDWTTWRAENAGAAPGAEELDASSVVILDRLRINPEWRGNGLGPIVAACAIARLGRGCRLAACYPAPFESPQTPDGYDRSVEALSRIWAKVGFTPWNDGVWMLDLSSNAAREALERLLPGQHLDKEDDATTLLR